MKPLTELRKGIIGVLFTVLAVPSLAAGLPDKPYVQVRGMANVELPPDALRMTVVVSELDKDLAAAKARVDERAAILVNAAKKMGVVGRDITTQALSINQEYDYSKNPRELLGNQVSRRITIVLRDLSKYSDLTAAVIKAKISDTANAEFFLTNEDELRNKVQVAAMKDARARATSLAAEEGRELVGVWSIDVSGGGSMRFEMMADRASGAALKAQAVSANEDPFEAGVLRIDGDVTVVYLLN